LALVTVNDTNDDIVDDLLQSHPPKEGTGEHGMYIRINGAVISSRGANVIPMDQLEGRWSNLGHRRMVESAAEMGMNMLRVWGGGGVLPLAFYNACDEHGILLYHDLMFVLEQNHGADDRALIHEEVQHIVQKLSHHPSIVLYAGCNECLAFYGTIDAYESLLTTLTQMDDTRAIWPVSPSRAGWKTGVHTLDGRPILGGVLKANRDDDYSKRALEEHGPYGHGGSLQFPTVNQVPSEANYTANVPPSLSTQPTGIMYPNTFVSEFGASVFSSFESMSAALPRDAWSIHGNHVDEITPTCQQDYYQVYVCNGTNDMTERNYACDNHIEAFFGDLQYNRDDVGAQSFQRQLYLCMISQTMWMKSQIETMRAENSFGLLLWQLNENWPTGGWGVIEYGPQPGMTGQVVGGRWKPVAYLLRDVLYRPVFAACGENALCYVRNDNIYSIDAIVKVEGWSLRENKMVAAYNYKVHLDDGPGWTKQFRLPQLVLDHAEVALIRVENDQSGEILMKSSVFLWRPPKSMPALSLPVGFVYDAHARGKRSEHATIRIQSDRLCLYVLLSTELEGHFSDNVFHLRPNQVVEVDFETADGATVNVDVLRRTLRIEHLGSFHHAIDDHQGPPQWPTSLARDVREAKTLLGLRMF
jgi:beta-mannosidase